MKKKIVLSDREYVYELKRFPRSKTVRLSFSSERGLLVTSPKWVSTFSIESALRNQESWILSLPKKTISQDFYQRYQDHKEQAFFLVTQKLLYWNRFYNFSWGSIHVRNQRTRWGSCSQKGNLNFSYKLALIPEHLADYIVVHELCHLKEMNHSSRFWDLVAKTMPDFKEKKRELRGLHLL